jgi:hypothetical protein
MPDGHAGFAGAEPRPGSYHDTASKRHAGKMPAVPEWPGGFRDPKWVMVDGVFWGGGWPSVSHLTERDSFCAAMP